MATNLPQMPQDVLRLIGRRLDSGSLQAMGRVSKRLHEAALQVRRDRLKALPDMREWETIIGSLRSTGEVIETELVKTIEAFVKSAEKLQPDAKKWQDSHKPEIGGKASYLASAKQTLAFSIEQAKSFPEALEDLKTSMLAELQKELPADASPQDAKARKAALLSVIDHIDALKGKANKVIDYLEAIAGEVERVATRFTQATGMAVKRG